MVARKIIVKGLTSSIGWNLGKKNKSSHLLDPFTSVPKIGTKNKKQYAKARRIKNDIMLRTLYSLRDPENYNKNIINSVINFIK